MKVQFQYNFSLSWVWNLKCLVIYWMAFTNNLKHWKPVLLKILSNLLNVLANCKRSWILLLTHPTVVDANNYNIHTTQYTHIYTFSYTYTLHTWGTFKKKKHLKSKMRIKLKQAAKTKRKIKKQNKNNSKQSTKPILYI